MGFPTPQDDSLRPRRFLVRAKDAIVMVTTVVPMVATLIILLYVVVGLFGPRPVDTPSREHPETSDSPRARLQDRPFQYP
jgi:hypothetical protein